MGGDTISCTECNGPGQYSDTPLSAACKLAPAGYKPKTSRDGIVQCTKNTFSIGARDTCSSCSEGGHSQPGSSVCEKCSTGKFYDDAENACELCPKNTFTISGAADLSGCTLCQNGGHSQPGSGYCEKCSTGTYYNEIENKCKFCPKNTFTISGAADISGCTPCEDDGHSLPGSGYCEKCSTGKYYDETTNSCELCPKNTFSTSGAGNISGCLQCASADEFAPAGSGYCSSCSSGKYYDEVDSTCRECSSGKFAATGGISISLCEICPVGFYSSSPGSPTCYACSAGKYANTEQTECLRCPPGKISGVASSACTVCETGKFAEGEGNVECRFCDDYDVVKGSVTYSNGTKSSLGCICPAGEFHNVETAACEKVEKGVKRYTAGMNVTTLDLEEGYWRTESSSLIVLKCLNEEHCVGGNDISKQVSYRMIQSDQLRRRFHLNFASDSNVISNTIDFIFRLTLFTRRSARKAIKGLCVLSVAKGTQHLEAARL